MSLNHNSHRLQRKTPLRAHKSIGDRPRPDRHRVCRCGESFTPSNRSLNRTKCPKCVRRLLEERRERRGDRRKREGEEPDRREWNRRKTGFRDVDYCEVCGKTEKELKAELKTARLHGDHIVPLRLVLDRGLGDPNVKINVLHACPSCHAFKKDAERDLYRGRIVDFWRKLKSREWPMKRVAAALQHFGIWIPPHLLECEESS